ncbi:hypothetical protein D9611_001627 [Ephemerocybe angulata]|uniref:DEAD/DEAH-box helicase domain-containing protein n=1 Tax=Ephemerocybe angulata TaxID=980116 RepID=A0A8H5CJW0_9AGAR|nr:hypothetical protein D9611_001627 [Tulosesus angulatus]
MDWIDGITKHDALNMVRTANIDDLQHWAAALPPEMVPKFHDEIGENYAAEPFCLRLCLLVWIASDFTQIPKALQLKAALAFLEKKNSLLYAGTGFGKTMMVVMAVLLEDPAKDWIVITISPLKRLQASQGATFWNKYGIRTLCINEDTTTVLRPGSISVNQNLVYDARTRKLGSCRNYIVTPEQFFSDGGNHVPAFGELCREVQRFRQHIKYVFVDEAHFIYTAGTKINGVRRASVSWVLLDLPFCGPVLAHWAC